MQHQIKVVLPDQRRQLFYTSHMIQMTMGQGQHLNSLEVGVEGLGIARGTVFGKPEVKQQASALFVASDRHQG